MTEPEPEVLHVVHPAFVISRNDGDRHFVPFLALARLHGLDPRGPNVVNYASGPMTRSWVAARERDGVEVRHYNVSASGDYPANRR